ncbi:hypothetical protein WICMUC_001172 [Wickerhamomyces mucosus]|uniref:Ribosome biogenesis protein SLX9 n=1 Tax=Wickerhamomyces mucosus TaxID=1378264 RepID=A0A9P8TI33_9ASCO|nr:hypothetical protein WICMUC_001172 [Wickerhamomyces mucosus]
MAKRTNLRSKIAAKSQSNVNKSSIPTESVLTPDPKAFLHEYKETKKDKLLEKKNDFLNRLRKSNDESNISKSSLRRRKRKQRDALLPKMQDLLTTLEDEVQNNDENLNNEKTIADDDKIKAPKTHKSINIVDSKKYVDHQDKGFLKNLPSSRTKKGSKIIEIQEKKQFGEVLKNSQFKQSPFDALKNAIQNRIKNEL